MIERIEKGILSDPFFVVVRRDWIGYQLSRIEGIANEIGLSQMRVEFATPLHYQLLYPQEDSNLR